MPRDWNQVRYFRQGDLIRVWETMRDEDRTELLGGGFTDPDALESALPALGARMLTWDSDMGPLAVVGVTPSGDPQVGYVWALASMHATKRWRFAVRNTEVLLNRLAAGYTVLANFKDTRNGFHISWLRRVGFTFINTHAGPNSQQYLEFVRIMK